MICYKFTPQAADYLFEIWSYIARDSTAAANRVEDAVYKACDFLAEGRLHGSVREDLTKLPLRFWTIQAFPISSSCMIPRAILFELSGFFTVGETFWQFSANPSPENKGRPRDRQGCGLTGPQFPGTGDT